MHAAPKSRVNLNSLPWASSGIKAQLANLYASPLIGSPRDFGKLIERETERWGKLVKGSQH